MNRAQKEVQQANLDEEKKVLRELKQVYTQAKKDVDEKIRQLNTRTDMQNLQSIIYQKQYQEALKKQIDGILDTLQGDEFSSVSEYLGKSYENGYVGVMYDLHSRGIPVITPINQEQVASALQTDSKISEGLYNRLGEDTERLKKSIRAELSRGTANGSTWLEIADHIAKGMNSPYKRAYNNAVRIARTEGHRVQCQADLDAAYAAKEKGADILKQWDATLDGRTRPEHREADMQIRELDEPFDVGGEKMQAPGIGGSARNVCNCRCTMDKIPRWALDEDELEEMKERAAFFGLDKTADFEEFKQKYLKAAEEEEDGLFARKKTAAVLGVDEKNIDFSKMDGKSKEAVYNGIKSVIEKYPALKGYTRNVVYDDTVTGYASSKSLSGTVKIGSIFQNYKELQKRYAYDVRMLFHPKGTTADSIVVHEMGHQLDGYLTKKGVYGGNYNPLGYTKRTSYGIREEVLKRLGYFEYLESEKQVWRSLGYKGKEYREAIEFSKKEFITSRVSEYANENEKEFFAECFAEYMTSKEPREAAKIFGEILDETMEGIQ